MAGIIIGIAALLQKICCPGTIQDEKPNQYPPQQQQYAGGYQGQPANQHSAYPPPQQGMNGHMQQQQHGGAWNGQNAPLQEHSQGWQNHQQQNHHHQQQQQQQQQHHQPQLGAPGKENRPPGGFGASSPIGPYHGNMENQINQSNAQYNSLRDQAREQADKAHSLFAESQEAYQRGDGASAHTLSEQGKAFMRKKDDLNQQAEQWIFKANNSDSPAGTIDLHGLYVKEALEKCENAINQAQRNNEDELRIIVGKGNHSENHVAKIKPAVEDLMNKYNLSAHLDPSNAGVLIVDLRGNEGGGRSRDVGGLLNAMNGKNGTCSIM